MRLFLLVCAGGALGSGARYLTGLALNLGAAWPRGTLLVNVLGCLLMGALMGSGPRTEWRTVLAAGVLGGFTTYSAFNQELLTLAGQGRPWAALGYAAVTLLGGLAAGALGLWLVQP